ncbi:MAG: hypothetical protein ICV69_02205 [Thermoleophilaceae bacterium]|nr:hypothetical protein [Thermoleophilaceae bacterium]
MMWKRACDPEGHGLRGLITGNVVRSGRVARGARSYFILRAPPGTYFRSLVWSGDIERRDCRYALHLWADGPSGQPIPVKNRRANIGCPRPGLAQAAGWPGTEEYPIDGTTRIVQRAVCVGAPRKPYCSARGFNYIRTFKAKAHVVDPAPPDIRVLQDNPFTSGQWVSGLQRVNYDAADNVGVKLARAVVSGVYQGEHARACDFALRVPCPNGPGVIEINTRMLSEGSQVLTVEALDAADNVRASDAPTTVRVDNTAPGAVAVAAEGGEAWRNRNDFGLLWANPTENDRAPVTAAHYRLCRVDGTDCRDGSRSGPSIDRLSDIAVPSPGEWQFRMWREDAAGNRESTNASLPVILRFDPEPPELGFEQLAASDPTRISVLVTDRVSGLAGGQIEISREGSDLWQTLVTRQDGDRLVARLDDVVLSPGSYRLRATARDRAGNEKSTDTRLDGQPMVVTLPVRIPTALRAGVARRRTERRVIGRRGNRREVRREVVTLEPSARVALGDQVRIGGRLESSDRQPIAGAEVLVLRRGVGAEQLAQVLTTDAQGAYAYTAQANASHTLRFVFQGTPLMLPAESEVVLSVPATSTIEAQPRRLRNGGMVRFGGRVGSLPTPPAGKLVELQVVLSGEWQTFRTTYTDSAGAWRVPYRFRRTCGVTRYRFRARIPAEAGYPFETGYTRAVRVVVRGGRCR